MQEDQESRFGRVKAKLSITPPSRDAEHGVGYTHLGHRRVVLAGDINVAALDLQIIFRVLSLGKVIKRISVGRENILMLRLREEKN